MRFGTVQQQLGESLRLYGSFFESVSVAHRASGCLRKVGLAPGQRACIHRANYSSLCRLNHH